MKTWITLGFLWTATLCVGSVRWWLKYHPWPTLPLTWQTIYVTNYVEEPRREITKPDPWAMPLPKPWEYYEMTNSFANNFITTNVWIQNPYVTNLTVTWITNNTFINTNIYDTKLFR